MKAEAKVNNPTPKAGIPSSFILHPHPSKVVDGCGRGDRARRRQLFLAQRPHGKAYAGYWSFPAARSSRQPVAQALRRELHEELGIDLVQAYP